MALQIPMSSPDLTDAERQAVQKVLNTPNLSMGHWILDFEKSFCDLTGAKHAIGVSSGTVLGLTTVAQLPKLKYSYL